MATVTGFEGLRHPRRTDLKQFSELFEPLFAASSDEARRQAAAALSQCPHLPQSVALTIGTAPISIAAIFLTRSTSITDATLLQIIRTQSQAHATAIARRDNLSVHVVDVLVERRQTASMPAKTPAAALPRSLERQRETPAIDPSPSRLLREEQLRADLRALARTGRQTAPVEAPLEPLDDLQQALLVRFARSGETNLFAGTLTAALSSHLDLADHILFDVSGQQLATVLVALSMPSADTLFVLSALYPHLSERFGGATRGDALLATLPPETCRSRLQSWLHTDATDSVATPGHEPYLAADRTADPRQMSVRKDTPAQGAIHVQQTRAFGRKR